MTKRLADNCATRGTRLTSKDKDLGLFPAYPMTKGHKTRNTGVGRTILALIIPLLSLNTLSQCSPTKFVVGQATGFFTKAEKVFEQESDLELAESAMASNLKILEAMLVGDPENEDLLLFTAKAFGGYTNGFVEDQAHRFEGQDPDLARYHRLRAKALYLRGRDFALRVVRARNEGKDPFEQKLPEFKKWLKARDKEWVPPLFWTTLNWGGAINADRQDMGQFAKMGHVVAVMEWITKKDPKFFNGGAYLFLGTYYGGVPAIYGNQRDKAKKYFGKLEKLTKGRHLMGKVFQAQYSAVQHGDRELFHKLCTEVVQADLNIWPEQKLINALAKRRAARLLKREDRYF